MPLFDLHIFLVDFSVFLIHNSIFVLKKPKFPVQIHDAPLIPSIKKDVPRQVMLDTFELTGRTTGVASTMEA